MRPIPAPGAHLFALWQKNKKTILGKIESSVTSCLENDPTMDYAQLQARFGTPQQIAESCVDEMDTPQLLDMLRIRRRIFKLVAAGVIAVIIMWAVVLVVAFIDAHIDLHGYGIYSMGI